MRPMWLALSGIAACNMLGASEQEAREIIEKEDGLSNVEVTKNGEAFDFTGTKGDELCTGTLRIEKGFGTKAWQRTSTCDVDTRACVSGAPDACVALADKLYQRDAKIFPTKAGELYRTACADKNGHACERAAEFESIDKQWAKVREYAQKGCDLDSGAACTRLGFTELDGHGTEKSVAKGLVLMKKGCQHDDMAACRAAAGLLLDAEPSDPLGAMPLAEKACKRHYDDSCIVLGLALFRNKKDYPVALEHLERACDGKDAKLRGLACNLAGAILADGLGMPPALDKALVRFEKACSLDFDAGCANAGKAFQQGKGAARDPVKAAELHAKACTLGLKASCAK